MPATPWDNALEALEWGKVVSRLCLHASSDPGRDRCAEIVPGTDLDAIRMASPFMKLLRAPAFSWFVVLTAHNRRHIWLIRQTLTGLTPGPDG